MRRVESNNEFRFRFPDSRYEDIPRILVHLVGFLYPTYINAFGRFYGFDVMGETLENKYAAVYAFNRVEFDVEIRVKIVLDNDVLE
jgi:hypothetical protein